MNRSNNVVMGKSNGKSETKAADLEHELPPADADENPTESRQVSTESVESSSAELQKLKAERDTLLDRLARMQAEFENARRRASREQQEFREFAVADAVKAILPVLDSFERALQTAPAAKSDLRS